MWRLAFYPRHMDPLYLPEEKLRQSPWQPWALRDAAIVDALEGSYKDPFMLHYNFPPYSVGETGMMGAQTTRNGSRTARSSVAAVMPDGESFPYTIRVVSEILNQMAPVQWQVFAEHLWL